MRVEPGNGYLGCSAPGRGSAAQQLLGRQLAGEHQAVMATAAGTIFFPDVSGYQAGLRVQPATAALLAKATEGSTFTDGSYADFRAQAGRVGAVFGAYHFVWSGTPDEARHVYQVVGKTPLMLDVENTNVRVILADVLSFVRNYRALGGVVHLAYLPRWYWAGTMGSPSLVPLQQLGVSVVSSNYTSYSDAGAGWAGYGGIVPVQWQYTDALPYGGQAVDFNAFRGSAAAYRTLLTGSSPAPTPTPQNSTEDTDMVIVQVDHNTVPKGTQWPGYFILTANAELVHIPSAQAKTNQPTSYSDNLDGLKQAGVNEAGFITYEFYQELVARQQARASS